VLLEGPLQVGIADLLSRVVVPFSRRLLGTLDQPTVGDEVLDSRKASDVVDLVKDDQSEDLTDVDDHIGAVGLDGLQKWSRFGFDVVVQNDFAVVVDDAEVYGAGVQVDATILMSFGVESLGLLLVRK